MIDDVFMGATVLAIDKPLHPGWLRLARSLGERRSERVVVVGQRPHMLRDARHPYVLAAPEGSPDARLRAWQSLWSELSPGQVIAIGEVGLEEAIPLERPSSLAADPTSLWVEGGRPMRFPSGSGQRVLVVGLRARAMLPIIEAVPSDAVVLAILPGMRRAAVRITADLARVCDCDDVVALAPQTDLLITDVPHPLAGWFRAHGVPVIALTDAPRCHHLPRSPKGWTAAIQAFLDVPDPPGPVVRDALPEVLERIDAALNGR